MCRISSIVRLIDAGASVRRPLPAFDDARLPEVCDEVFDIGGANRLERPIAEMLDDRFQAVVDRPRECEAFREDMPLFVDLGELPERLRAHLAPGIDPAIVEGAGANGVLQFVQRRAGIGLGLDIANLRAARRHRQGPKAAQPWGPTRQPRWGAMCAVEATRRALPVPSTDRPSIA